MANGFFAYQRRKLDILKYWGVGNVLYGAVGWLFPHPVVKHICLQAASWGAIDAALAVVGQRGALHKDQQWKQGELSEHDLGREVRNFRHILLFNAFLDFIYIFGGYRLWSTAGERRSRQGMGIGIIIQGLFLLLYDALLARDVGRRWG
jgi:hypothetical protein